MNRITIICKYKKSVVVINQNKRGSNWMVEFINIKYKRNKNRINKKNLIRKKRNIMIYKIY